MDSPRPLGLLEQGRCDEATRHEQIILRQREVKQLKLALMLAELVQLKN
jgi:hypothetical protein